MKSKPTGLTLAHIYVLSLSALPVWAQQPTAVNTFETVVIQGQLEHAPLGTTVVDKDTLQKRQIQRWEDLGKGIEPGLHFNPNNGSINLRGMDKDRVQTRLDGVRIPWLDDGARGVQGGLNSISFNSLSNLQVQRGVNSGLALQSISPSDVLTDGKNIGALLSTDYSSADNSKGANIALAGKIQDSTHWLLQLDHRRGDALKNYGGNGGIGPDREKMNPEKRKQHNALLKLEHELDSGHQLQLIGETFRQTADINNRRDQGPDSNFALERNQTKEHIDRDRIILGYHYDNEHSQASLKAYWQRQQLASEQNAWRLTAPEGRYERDNQVKEDNYGLLGELHGVAAAGYPLEHHWSVGADAYLSKNTQHSAGYDNCAISPSFACNMLHTNQADRPKVKGRHLSLWAKNQLQWAEGRYALTPALQFDYYQFKPQHTTQYNDNPNSALSTMSQRSGSRASPSLLFEFSPHNDWTLYTQYGFGYKAPNATQLYTNYGAPGTYLRIGNPQLKAETSQGWELGTQWGNEQQGAQLNVYQTHYKNFIDEQLAIDSSSSEWNPAWDGQYPMGVNKTINRSKVRIQGIELSGHWRTAAHWYGRGSLAWARGKDTSKNEHLHSVAPLKTVLAVGYDSTQWGAEAALTAALKNRKVADTSTDFQAPGYSVVDLSAWWTPSTVKGLQLQAGIHNLFDKKYWEALHVPQAGGRDAGPIAMYTEPGRSFKLNLSYHY